MVRTVSVENLSEQVRSLLKETSETNEPIVVESDGERFGVLMTPEAYDRLVGEGHERAWATVDRIRERNADKDPDEILRFVTDVVEEVRQEHYERELRENQSSR